MIFHSHEEGFDQKNSREKISLAVCAEFFSICDGHCYFADIIHKSVPLIRSKIPIMSLC